MRVSHATYNSVTGRSAPLSGWESVDWRGLVGRETRWRGSDWVLLLPGFLLFTEPVGRGKTSPPLQSTLDILNRPTKNTGIV